LEDLVSGQTSGSYAQSPVVEALRAADEPIWDAFVAAHVQGTQYHRVGWRQVLEASFPVKAHYLLARQAGVVTGILPLVEQRSPLFGARLMSLPFSSYGGVLATNPDAERALTNAAAERALALGVRVLELRQGIPLVETPTGPGTWIDDRRKVDVFMDLGPDAEEVFKRSTANRRRDIRRLLRDGFVFEVAGAERLDDFYGLFRRAMRNLGTPVYGRAFFDHILSRCSDRASIGIVRLKGTVVAAAILMAWGDVLETPYACASAAYDSQSPTGLLYWGSIEEAIRSGCRRFDFGRSTVGSGSMNYKLRFGASTRPLPWRKWIPAGYAEPSLAREDARFLSLIKVWQRLPMWVADRLGPIVSAQLY
jgi:serine/alanine adding enzyme